MSDQKWLCLDEIKFRLDLAENVKPSVQQSEAI